MGADDIADCQPVYETLPGWTDSTVGITDYNRLPVQAQAYLRRIEEVTGVPIHMISTSPDRDHTILIRDPFQP
jgi:adenylosuccinate synthase